MRTCVVSRSFVEMEEFSNSKLTEHRLRNGYYRFVFEFRRFDNPSVSIHVGILSTTMV